MDNIQLHTSDATKHFDLRKIMYLNVMGEGSNIGFYCALYIYTNEGYIGHIYNYMLLG